eukprot:1595207-Pleurochrysis_carterae.AAC.1
MTRFPDCSEASRFAAHLRFFAKLGRPLPVWEVERAVDDFVFMCMLVGNDFIPGLPNLDVADGALNLMMRT